MTTIIPKKDHTNRNVVYHLTKHNARGYIIVYSPFYVVSRVWDEAMNQASSSYSCQIGFLMTSSSSQSIWRCHQNMCIVNQLLLLEKENIAATNSKPRLHSIIVVQVNNSYQNAMALQNL